MSLHTASTASFASPSGPADARPLAGKVAVVTAASRGIGRGIAERLGAGGADVVVNWHTSETAAAEVVAGIESSGSRAVAVQADLGAPGAVDRIFDRAVDEFGAVDILVNNAGISLSAPTADLDESDLDRLLAVNVKGSFRAMQLAARHLRDGGRVVNISTGYTRSAYPNVGAYAGTKAAVEQMGLSLAKELAPRGITVNAVLPGLVDTDGISPDVRLRIDEFVAMTPLGRLGRPEDIADIVAFLVSDHARWVTGQAIVAAGGLV